MSTPASYATADITAALAALGITIDDHYESVVITPSLVQINRHEVAPNQIDTVSTVTQVVVTG